MDGISGGRTRPSGSEDHWEGLYRNAPEALPWEVEQTPPEFTQWAALLEPGASVLDLGCGRGHHAIAMARCGFIVSGIDFSAAAVDAARRNAAAAGVITVTFEVADILGYRAGSVFDLVYDYSVLHHIEVKDRPAYARTVAGAVRPDGLFAVVCYADDDAAAEGGRRRIGKLGNVIHHPTRREVEDLFSAGFRSRSHEPTRLGRGAGHSAHHLIFQRAHSA